MDKVQKIREEVERLREKIMGIRTDFADGQKSVLTKLIAFIDTLQEEPVSEDLEEAAKRYALNNTPYEDCTDEMSDAFKAGARWQEEKDNEEKVLIYKHGFDDCKEQFEKNRLAACDRQTAEEAEVEQSFVTGIIECEHRRPTFDDAIKYGYHQAEKDLELTWKDISKILCLDQQVCGVMGISDYTHNHQQAMEEVLKRFKKIKEE